MAKLRGCAFWDDHRLCNCCSCRDQLAQGWSISFHLILTFFDLFPAQQKAVCKQRPNDNKNSKGEPKKSSDVSGKEGGNEGPDEKADSEKAAVKKADSKKGRKVVQPRIDEFVGKRKQPKKSNVETDADADAGGSSR